MHQERTSRLDKHFRALGDEGGAAAIEFAIVIPVLILMALAILDLGQAVLRGMQVQNAAQMGAQYAFTRGFDKESIAEVVTRSTGFTEISASPAPNQFCGCASKIGIDPIDCDSKCGGANAPGSYVTVFAEGSYSPIIPYPFVPPSFKFQAQSTVRIQ